MGVVALSQPQAVAIQDAAVLGLSAAVRTSHATAGTG
jgi:hypothetical protein